MAGRNCHRAEQRKSLASRWVSHDSPSLRGSLHPNLFKFSSPGHIASQIYSCFLLS